MSALNESLLEMIYFIPLKRTIESILGRKINRIYKPSPQKEAWLGFTKHGLIVLLVRRIFTKL